MKLPASFAELKLRKGNTGYEAGQVTASAEGEAVLLDEPVATILFLPAEACTVSLNEQASEIYLPAETWTPVDIVVTSFIVKGAGLVYWQGWR